MTVLVLVHLVVLTAAVVTLFAMMGELARRVPDPTRSDALRPLPEVRLGGTVHPLPVGLGRPPGLLLVFSTTCGSCEALAGETARFLRSGVDVVGLLVSAASAESGREFVDRHDLGGLPVAVDVRGAYSAGVLGVAISPAAVAVDAAGTVRAAVAFGGFGGLRDWADRLGKAPVGDLP